MMSSSEFAEQLKRVDLFRQFTEWRELLARTGMSRKQAYARAREDFEALLAERTGDEPGGAGHGSAALDGESSGGKKRSGPAGVEPLDISDEELEALAKRSTKIDLSSDFAWAYRQFGKRKPDLSTAPSTSAVFLLEWSRENSKDFMAMATKRLAADRSENEEQTKIEADTKRLLGMLAEFSEELKCPNCGKPLMEM